MPPLISPRVSVLIPTYDHAAFLPRALDSLLAQREQRWEAIVVEDGSPDDTREVVRPYLDDPRFSYHRFADNRGLGAALSAAQARATAPYVAYLPS